MCRKKGTPFYANNSDSREKWSIKTIEPLASLRNSKKLKIDKHSIVSITYNAVLKMREKRE